jgi:hypothetical protein
MTSDLEITTPMPQSPGPLSFGQLFAGVLLEPVKTFSAIGEDTEESSRTIVYAAIVVVLAVLLSSVSTTSAGQLKWVLATIPVGIMLAFIEWLVFTGAVALPAACFNQPPARAKALLACLGWSFLPWLFFSPIFCLRQLLGPCFVIACFVPVAWTFVLQILAIGKSYKMKGWQVLALVIIAPSLISATQLFQFFDFVGTLFSALT